MYIIRNIIPYIIRFFLSIYEKERVEKIISMIVLLFGQSVRIGGIYI